MNSRIKEGETDGRYRTERKMVVSLYHYRYRGGEIPLWTLKANRALVFSDTRQSQHMQQAWLITRKAGYVPDSFSLEHKNFGMMLGKDGKPFKTRTGGTVKLADLLDEAIERATLLSNEKNTNLSR